MKKKKNNKTFTLLLIASIMFTVALPLASCSQTKSEANSETKPATQQEQPPTLDGKSFAIQTMEKDKPETAVAENCMFADGYFDNMECHQYGFGKAKYTAENAGDGVMRFEATMDGGSEGSMTWKGEVNMGNIKGDMVWKKEGQADISYTFSGTAK